MAGAKEKALEALKKSFLGRLFGGAETTPPHVEELVRKLEEKDFSPMDFGTLKGDSLKRWQGINDMYPEGPVKISDKTLRKFNEKRLGNDHISPVEFADKLNQTIYGNKSKLFWDYDREIGNAFMPEGEHTWRAVLAPHEEFSGLATGYKRGTKEANKAMAKLAEMAKNKGSVTSDGRPLPSGLDQSDRVRSLDDFLPPKVKNPVDETVGFSGWKVNGVLPGSVVSDNFFDVNFKPTEKGLETPWLDPTSMGLAGIGVKGVANKGASMAMDPAINAMMQGLFGE